MRLESPEVLDNPNLRRVLHALSLAWRAGENLGQSCAARGSRNVQDRATRSPIGWAPVGSASIPVALAGLAISSRLRTATFTHWAVPDRIQGGPIECHVRSWILGAGERAPLRPGEHARRLLLGDTRYPAGCRVLEVGCGVGAQTVHLARSSPGAEFICIDVASESLSEAAARAEAEVIHNVSFRQADFFDLPYPHESFDHVFMCFVLEHLHDPARAMAALRLQLRPGGTITVIEGDHGSALLSPDSAKARRVIQCLVDLQARKGGDALIGRKLFPLLRGAEFAAVSVSPRMVYADASRQGWVEGFTMNTFTAMVEGVREEAIALGLVGKEAWQDGIEDLRRTARPEGVFCYTFFKAVGERR